MLQILGQVDRGHAAFTEFTLKCLPPDSLRACEAHRIFVAWERWPFGPPIRMRGLRDVPNEATYP